LAEGRTRALLLTEAQPMVDRMQAGLTIPAIANFARSALAANSDAQIYLYESWPPLSGEVAS
jgi:hypothetical protein